MKCIGVLGLVVVFLCPAWAGSIPLKERRTNETVRPIPRQNASGAKSGCECGLANSVSRIVNGNPSDQNEYPWLVGLTYNFGSYIKPWCGGSVYNNEWIITAAHCVDIGFILSNPAYLKVVLGMYNYVTSSPTPTTRTVDNIVVHPDYNSDTLNNDIALLHMVTPVVYSHAIRPVCMPDVSADYTGLMATVTGWGVLNFGEAPRPDMAHEVQVLIRTVDECQESYGAGVNGNMICAGTDSFDKDACQGDSGGPLTVPVDGRDFLAGLVSWGAGCALSPYYGVYTDVPNYVIDFIQENAGTACTP